MAFVMHTFKTFWGNEHFQLLRIMDDI